MTRALFFDLDDTLCGYWEAAHRALRETFVRCRPDGCDVPNMVDAWSAAFQEFLPEVRGDAWYPAYLKSGEPSRTELMRRALERLGCSDPVKAAELSRTYAQLRNEYLELFPDVLPALEQLKERFPLGLITNGPADTQRQEIERLGIESWFKVILIEGEMGFGKPTPEVFRLAEAGVGHSPENILFVGNSYPHDVLPAIKAGWHTAWIRRPVEAPDSQGPLDYKPEARPSDGPRPDFEISNLTELLPQLLGKTAS